jgi:hypothetical protein
MDFSSLAIAPLAALVTVLMILVSLARKAHSEDRVLAPAIAVSFILNLLLFQPWRAFGVWRALLEIVIFTTLGFAFGALIALILVKGLRLARRLTRSR